MPVAVTTAVPLTAQRTVLSDPGTSSSISLTTAPLYEKPTYHLMEVPSDMVHLFEAQETWPTRRVEKESSLKDANGSEEDDEVVGNERKAKRQKTLCIKGRNDDEAVLCTDSKTWQVREMTQSNSLLLCSLHQKEKNGRAPNGSALSVRSNIVEILELVPVVPRMGRLNSILKASAYAGEDEEKQRGPMRRYTPQQVASIVQASPGELREGLRHAHVVELDGYHRMVDPAYMADALRVLLAHLDANALAFDGVPEEQAVSALTRGCEMRQAVAEAIVTTFFGCRREVEGANVKLLSLYDEAIVRFLGLYLLRTFAKEKAMREEEFMEKWATTVGSSLSAKARIQLLDGNYLKSPAPPAEPTALEPSTIQHFAASELSLDVAVRFQELFRARAQWTFDDLCPFLEDVAIDDKKRDNLLLKFARTSQASISIPETKQERRTRKQRGDGDNPPMRNVKLYSARLRY